MGFKEYFLANELKIKGVMDLKDNPLIPTEIPKTGFQNSGARKMGVLAQSKPYTPKPLAVLFRKPS
jgi:hypothetical protein